MSSTLFWHTLRLPMEFFGQRHAGEVGSRVAINDRIAQLLSGQLATTALNVLTVVFYVVIMFQYDVILTLIGVFFAALSIVALRLASRQRIDTNQRLLVERGKLTGVSMGGLQSIETLKATGSESEFFVRWAGLQAKLVEAQQQLGSSTQVVSGVPPMLAALATAAILGVGAVQVMSGDLTIGMLVAFQSLMASFMAPIGQLVSLGTTLQETQGDLNRVDDVLRYQTDPQVPATFATGARPSPWHAERAVGASPAREPHLRLQPPRAAADRGLQPDPRARQPRGPGGRERQRQVDRRQARDRPVSSRGQARSSSTGGRARRYPTDCSPPRWRWSTRTSPCSRAR